jgi:hypothetical protein
MSDVINKLNKDPVYGFEHKKKISDGLKKHYSDPIQGEATRKKISKGTIGKTKSKETKKKMSDAAVNKPKSESAKKKISDAAKIRCSTIEWRKQHSEAVKGFHHSEEWKKQMSESRKGDKHPNYGKHLSESTRQKQTETRCGGFWYGNITYVEKKKYCELWNHDLWKRIDTYQNYKSILSDKTKADNNSRALSRHHIYWQEKACCKWDEDSQGYYAMINIGTAKRPDMYKYYVGNDPNKFVLLTSQEHGMVSKDKLKWIKIFENLINNKLKGKCYFTKEEMKAFTNTQILIPAS